MQNEQIAKFKILFSNTQIFYFCVYTVKLSMYYSRNTPLLQR